MHSLPITLFLAQFAATLFMTGLIWFVQIVHYPLFTTIHAHTSQAAFRDYETRHANRTSFIVFPPMAIELLTALAVLYSRLRPGFVPATAAYASALLVVLIWISTGLIQVPLHNRLSGEASRLTIRRLVLSNWLRTVLWSARAILLLATLLNAL